MPMIYNPGEKVGSLTVERDLHNGAMAVSYAARSARGEQVFLKQYKSPSIRVKWYRDFMAYQKEMRNRIENTDCRDFCYRFLDSFEFQRCFFQSFEFLDKSDSLQFILERARTRPDTVNWEQRRLMARVLMSGIRTMHLQKVVHADLKPDNIMLIHDESIRMKYRLKIIDMDFSLFTDRQAPWHGHEGYFGTPGYASPEHMAGKVPVPASDVFTCGLMLYELLAGGHPYRNTPLEYAEALTKHRPEKPRLQGTMPAPARDDHVIDILHRCLHPDPARRPTAAEVFEALTGTVPPSRTPPPPPPERGRKPTHEAVPPPPPPPPPTAPVGRLVLRGASGQELSFGARTVIGRVLCARFGDESIYCSDEQFTLDRDETGWWVVPAAVVPRNATLLNGKQLTGRTKLHDGDTIGVGREGGTRVRLPLRVCIS